MTTKNTGNNGNNNGGGADNNEPLLLINDAVQRWVVEIVPLPGSDDPSAVIYLLSLPDEPYVTVAAPAIEVFQSWLERVVNSVLPEGLEARLPHVNMVPFPTKD